MSSPESSSSAGKKRSSPVRNVIGLIVLIAVLVFGWLEYSAKSGYNRAVTALDSRTQDESKALLTVQEAETILGKAPDTAASDPADDDPNYTKKTYTWRGLLKSYRLTAFYTKQKDPQLHHFETEGSQTTEQKTAAGSEPASAPSAATAPSTPAAPVDAK
jgi:hypothetical protein